MKRIIDIALALACLIVLMPVALMVALAVKLSSAGPIIYWSDRIGRHSQIFQMPKFRTMVIDTPVLATHELEKPETWLTPIGKFLRASSLDELPQILPILLGKMSFVGPRPALYSQDDLIALRQKYGVDSLRPGLTGWAQINGRDELSIEAKVEFDLAYLRRQSVWFDMVIIAKTALKVVRRSGISH